MKAGPWGADSPGFQLIPLFRPTVSVNQGGF